MLAVQGPQAREIVQALADAPLPARLHAARAARSPARDALVCGTGYTGEDGVELLVRARATPRALWDEVVRRGAAPAGLGRARHAAPGGLLPPLRQRPDGGARPDRGRPRLVLQGGHGLHRRRGRRAPCATPGRPRSSCRSRSTGPGIPRQGNPVVGGGEVTSGTLSPCLGVGIGMAYVPAERGRAGTELEIDVRGKHAPPPSCKHKPALPKGDRMADGTATPRICSTTPSTTGRGSTATAPRRSASPGTRRTRSARSSSSTRRRSARSVDEGRVLRRGRVGQGRLGRDRAAVRARSSRSTRRSATRPR